MEILHNLSNISIGIIFFSAFFGYLLFNNRLALYFLIYLVVAGYIGNDVLKLLTHTFSPKNKLFMRPKPIIGNCNIYPSISGVDWGMPSGHAQIIALTATFWTMYLWKNEKQSNLRKWIATIFLLAIAIFVGYSRVYLGYHNWFQVAVGYIIGILEGWWFYYLLDKYLIL